MPAKLLLNMDDEIKPPANDPSAVTKYLSQPMPRIKDPTVKVAIDDQKAVLFLRNKYGMKIKGVNLNSAANPINSPTDLKRPLVRRKQAAVSRNKTTASVCPLSKCIQTIGENANKAVAAYKNILLPDNKQLKR